MLSTMSDELGRPNIGQLLEDRPERLFHVGRLDMDSEGLLLLTNDGDLAHRLTHPSYGVPKTYMAEIPGPVPRDLGRRLRAGIELEDGPAKVDSFEVVDVHNGRAVVEVVLHEGRKHIVRRLLDAVDHPVSRLVRTKIGDVQLGHQRPGHAAQAEPGGDRAAVQGGRVVSGTPHPGSGAGPERTVRHRHRRAGRHREVDRRPPGGAGAARRIPRHRCHVPDRHPGRAGRRGRSRRRRRGGGVVAAVDVRDPDRIPGMQHHRLGDRDVSDRDPWPGRSLSR